MPAHTLEKISGYTVDYIGNRSEFKELHDTPPHPEEEPPLSVISRAMHLLNLDACKVVPTRSPPLLFQVRKQEMLFDPNFKRSEVIEKFKKDTQTMAAQVKPNRGTDIGNSFANDTLNMILALEEIIEVSKSQEGARGT